MADRLDQVLDGVQKAGQIASAANGLVGVAGGLVGTVISIIREIRQSDTPVQTPEQIAARLELAIADYSAATASLVDTNAAYWQIPEKDAAVPAAGAPAEPGEHTGIHGTTSQGNPSAAAPPQ